MEGDDWILLWRDGRSMEGDDWILFWRDGGGDGVNGPRFFCVFIFEVSCRFPPPRPPRPLVVGLLAFVPGLT